jgi:hypothetical protein
MSNNDNVGQPQRFTHAERLKMAKELERRGFCLLHDLDGAEAVDYWFLIRILKAGSAHERQGQGNG